MLICIGDRRRDSLILLEETKTKTVKLSAYVIDHDDMGKKQIGASCFFIIT